MLLKERPEAVFAALASRPPAPAQLDGASELFASLDWRQQRRPAVPQPLRSLLIGYVERAGTEPMKFRMRPGHGRSTDGPAGPEK